MTRYCAPPCVKDDRWVDITNGASEESIWDEGVSDWDETVAVAFQSFWDLFREQDNWFRVCK